MLIVVAGPPGGGKTTVPAGAPAPTAATAVQIARRAAAGILRYP